MSENPKKFHPSITFIKGKRLMEKYDVDAFELVQMVRIGHLPVYDYKTREPMPKTLRSLGVIENNIERLLFKPDEVDRFYKNAAKTTVNLNKSVERNQTKSESHQDELPSEVVDIILKPGKEAQILYKSMKTSSGGPGFKVTNEKSAKSRRKCAISWYEEHPEDFEIIERKMLDDLETYMCDNQDSSHSGRYIIGHLIKKSLNKSELSIGSYQKCFVLYKKYSRKIPA